MCTALGFDYWIDKNKRLFVEDGLFFLLLNIVFKTRVNIGDLIFISLNINWENSS